jgi:hypothetical protein
MLYSGANNWWQYGACTLHAGYLRLQVHTLSLFNSLCFSTTTIMAGMRRSVTKYVHYLSCSSGYTRVLWNVFQMASESEEFNFFLRVLCLWTVSTYSIFMCSHVYLLCFATSNECVLPSCYTDIYPQNNIKIIWLLKLYFSTNSAEDALLGYMGCYFSCLTDNLRPNASPTLCQLCVERRMSGSFNSQWLRLDKRSHW